TGPRAMRLLTRTPNLTFTYPYLSPGTITSIETRPDGGVNWRGQIRPTVPFLPNPLDVKYENDSLQLSVDINGRYSNGTLRATASGISFTWRSFTGSLDVTYTQTGEQPGRVTGTGTIRVARGNVRGSVEVTLHDSGRLSGRGTVTYPLTIRGTRIDATAGIIIDEAQNVRVEGSLRLPQPIELFRSFGNERQLFRFDRSIPIPGLSVGPVGVVAIIEGGISAGYSFGPGQLRNVAIEAAFNPLAEHIDPNIRFHCDLHIPASANLTAMIGGGIGVEAGLARVRGTLRINARLGLDAVAGGPLDVSYENQVFSIRARPGISAALVLGLSLDANARAEAGFGPFTVGTEKTWNLGRRDVTLGRFSVYAPISYSSDAGLQVPGMDELEWGPIETPDPANILSQLFNGATASERETPS
ncbi:MAG: hypothetical protein ABUS56_02175, partial [Acidobacteriota bacterium]